jgi:hypothetical protein
MTDTFILASENEQALTLSLKKLGLGQRGVISLEAASRLFSAVEEREAFGVRDPAGLQRIRNFAALNRCTARRDFTLIVFTRLG